MVRISCTDTSMWPNEVMNPMKYQQIWYRNDLYSILIDCLVLSGIAVATIPMSVYKRSIAPFVIGFIFGFVPDLLYANWRCDAEYKAFKVHAAAFRSSSNIDQQSMH